MITAPKLYGITAGGTVVSRRTPHGYSFGVVRDGKLLTCHWDSNAALLKTKPGDQIVGLTPAPLYPSSRKYSVKNKDRIFTFPLCRACSNPGLGQAATYVDGKVVFAPACITKHAKRGN